MNDLLPPLLTAQDVALWLSLPTAKVVRLARQGEIPCLTLPTGELAFEPDALAAWIKSRKTESSEGGHPKPKCVARKIHRGDTAAGNVADRGIAVPRPW